MEESETTRTPGPTITWVVCILFFFKFICLFVCLLFNWQRCDDAGGEKHLRNPLQPPARGSWAELIHHPWALEEVGAVVCRPPPATPGERGLPTAPLPSAAGSPGNGSLKTHPAR